MRSCLSTDFLKVAVRAFTVFGIIQVAACIIPIAVVSFSLPFWLLMIACAAISICIAFLWTRHDAAIMVQLSTYLSKPESNLKARFMLWSNRFLYAISFFISCYLFLSALGLSAVVAVIFTVGVGIVLLAIQFFYAKELEVELFALVFSRSIPLSVEDRMSNKVLALIVFLCALALVLSGFFSGAVLGVFSALIFPTNSIVVVRSVVSFILLAVVLYARTNGYPIIAAIFWGVVGFLWMGSALLGLVKLFLPEILLLNNPVSIAVFGLIIIFSIIYAGFSVEYSYKYDELICAPVDSIGGSAVERGVGHGFFPSSRQHSFSRDDQSSPPPPTAAQAAYLPPPSSTGSIASSERAA